MAFNDPLNPDDPQFNPNVDGGAPQTDWRIAGTRHFDSSGNEISADEAAARAAEYSRKTADPNEFWRAHHNDPAYRQMAEQNASAQAKVQEIQAKAQFDAATFEKRYTSKQKSDLSRLSAVRQNIDSNPDFSEDEKVAAKRAIDLQMMGIKPLDLPKLSPYQQGQGIGDSWTQPDTGAIVTRRADGNTHVLVRPDQTIDAKRADATHKLNQAQLAADAKHTEELLKFRMKLAAETVPEVDKNGQRTWRPRRPDEVEAAMQAVIGGGRQTQQPQQPQEVSSQPRSKVEFDALPSGSYFIAPDGTTRRKP